ncbi:hypothetical protein BaRGS_00004453 [Batillaria attramentaria]|uniref:G patch domain-containing protein 11 n=1 Tax=Batillaria attramentaria TaxID=370345 RepID=A0ABD0LX19_9CAEN
MSHSQNSDDEEDYMSDAILFKCEDKRPGLVSSQAAKQRIAREKKQQLSNETNKVKPKKVIEQEKRTEGLTTAITSDNKGFSLLQKMGYKPGMVIGKKGTGRAEPVPIEIKTDRGGLGRETEVKRKQEEVQAMRASMAAKRQRLEVKQKQSFLQHMSDKFASKTTEKDLRTSQKACYQLDTENEAEQLQALTEYLRTTHCYCIWCGTKYEDADDLRSNCPGDTAEAHD